VIGNPPYGAYFNEIEKKYIKTNFDSYKYRYDSYIYFIEQSLKLIKPKGAVSFITPEVWLRLENCAPLRRLIAKEAGFDLLKVYGENVFKNVIVNTVVFLLRRGIKGDSIRIEVNEETWQISTADWQASDLFTIDYRLRPQVTGLINKIRSSNNKPLSQFGEVIQGITPYDKYRGQNEQLIKRRGYHYQYKHDKNCGMWLAGKDISRYKLEWSGEWLCYGPWLAAPRDPRFFQDKRILFREVPGTGKSIQATLAEDIYYHGHSITPFKPYSSNEISIEYLLGIANSRLITWYGGLMLPNFGKDIFPKLNPQDIKDLPIHVVDFSTAADKARHDKVVEMVKKMLEMHGQLTGARTEQERTMLQRRIEATDAQIDRLVYELYGLTEEEIRVVEEASR
jgi:hypothetical protein